MVKQISSKEEQFTARALDVFLHYGYRKTSLDEVANAVELSRQTLYQRYGSKKNLFTSILRNYMDLNLIRIEKEMKNKSYSIREKLLLIIEIWSKHYLTSIKKSPHAKEILAESNELIGGYYGKKTKELLKIIAAELNNHDISALYTDINISAEQLARVFFSSVEGLLEKCDDYKALLKEANVTISVICNSPLSSE